jgi:hypothetical protein
MIRSLITLTTMPGYNNVMPSDVLIMCRMVDNNRYKGGMSGAKNKKSVSAYSAVAGSFSF